LVTPIAEPVAFNLFNNPAHLLEIRKTLKKIIKSAIISRAVSNAEVGNYAC